MKSIKNKVFSGALQFTLFIGVVVALLLTGLVMLQNTHTFFIEQSKSIVENIQLSNSGINYLLNQENLIADTITLNQLSNNNQKIQVQLSKWGVFEKAIVKTTHRKKIFYKSALLGTQIKATNRPTIYLQDNFKPLVVVGRSLLKGTVYIPSQGINPGYIAGESFYGQQLVQGIIKTSGYSLPRLKKLYKEELELLGKNTNLNPQNYLGADSLKKVTNSFIKPTKTFYSKGLIELNSNELIGNIIIKSDQLIRIKKTAILKDIIIIAPKVEIEDGVQGNFQVIASKKITVGKNCKLNYPTALVLIQEKESIIKASSSIEDNQITVDKSSEIRGSICYFKSTKENDFKTQLSINEQSIIKGEIYCQGNFELKGKVIGSVYTEQFVTNMAGSIFINHIYNGTIVDDNFPESFCGILFENKSKGIAKWMY